MGEDEWPPFMSDKLYDATMDMHRAIKAAVDAKRMDALMGVASTPADLSELHALNEQFEQIKEIQAMEDQLQAIEDQRHYLQAKMNEPDPETSGTSIRVHRDENNQIDTLIVHVPVPEEMAPSSKVFGPVMRRLARHASMIEMDRAGDFRVRIAKDPWWTLPGHITWECQQPVKPQPVTVKDESSYPRTLHRSLGEVMPGDTFRHNGHDYEIRSVHLVGHSGFNIMADMIQNGDLSGRTH